MLIDLTPTEMMILANCAKARATKVMIDHGTKGSYYTIKQVEEKLRAKLGIKL